MSKKNLPIGEIRVYPLDKNLDSRWFVRWKMPNGKRRDLNILPFKTVEEREKAVQLIIKRIEANPIDPTIRQKNPSFTTKTARLFEVLEDRTNRLEKKTVQSYASHIRNLDKFCKENNHKHLTSAVAESFITHLIDIGRAPATVNGHRTTFSIHFQKLIKKKEVRKNPFADVEGLRGQSESRAYFKSNQLIQLKRAIAKDAPFLTPVCEYMYYLLCRPKELRLLKVEDVDFDNWTIRIKFTVGKTNKQRFCVVPDALKEIMLKNDIVNMPPNFFLIGKDGIPAEKSAGINYFSSKMTAILRKMGFSRDYTLYSLKNTGAIVWYKAGIGLIEIQRQIGHADIKTTMIYFRSMGFEDYANVRKNVPTF
jgi:integrase